MSGLLITTAVIGKHGPAAIQDVTARDGLSTIVIDDKAGNQRTLVRRLHIKKPPKPHGKHK